MSKFNMLLQQSLMRIRIWIRMGTHWLAHEGKVKSWIRIRIGFNADPKHRFKFNQILSEKCRDLLLFFIYSLTSLFCGIRKPPVLTT